jgi:hypothetical protein
MLSDNDGLYLIEIISIILAAFSLTGLMLLFNKRG